MEQSVIYQEWREEFLQRGRQEGERLLILRQLSYRFGNVPEELRDGLVFLSLDQLESLGEALLSFRDLSDLREWLTQH